jgi:hypothetical protein
MFSSFNRRKGKLLGKNSGNGGGSSNHYSNIKGGGQAAGGGQAGTGREQQASHASSQQHRLGIPSATSSTVPDDNDGGSIHGIRSLIGGSGVSLDGQSLTIPPSSVVLPYSSTDDNHDGYGYGARNNPGSPSMDNSIDMYSYTLSAPGAHGEDEGEVTDEEDVENRRGRPRGYDDEGEDGSASAAMIMMGMSTHSRNVGDFLGGGNANSNAAPPPDNADGLGNNQSELAASSSASALFDGRSLQISSNEDDDMSSINSSSIYQGQHQQYQQRSTGGGGNLSSLSSPPPTGGGASGYTPSPATSNKYLGPYGSKLKIIGSINLVDDDINNNEDGALPATARRDVSRRIVQGPVTVEAGVAAADAEEDPASAAKPKALWCCGCAPLWIKRAPRWLQIVLLLSAVLALLAVVLVAVSVSFAFRARGSSASSSASPDGSGGDEGTGVLPPLRNDTSTTAPNPNVNGDDSSGGNVSDDLNGTLTNITTVSNFTTSSPTIDWSSLVRTSFGVTAGRYPDELAAIVPELLPNFTSTRTVNTAYLPGETGGDMADVESWPQFLVHLGDWNSPAYTNCGASAYTGIADMFSTSTIPVYFVPGDNEYNGTWHH